MGAAVALVSHQPATTAQSYQEVRVATAVFWSGVVVAASLPLVLLARRSVPRLRQSVHSALSVRKCYLAAAVLFIAADVWGLWPFFRQQVALREIERKGGNYGFADPRPFAALRNVIGSQWLTAFDQVSHVNLKNLDVTDDFVAYLNDIRGPESVWLANTKITDAGLRQLRGLDRVKNLDLSDTAITDVGLEAVARLQPSNVTGLFLSQTGVTDAGLRNLAAFPQLASLGLCDTAVSDAGLSHLSTATRLTMLSLQGTQVTDAGLESLKQVPRLFYVDLSRTRVTEEGIASLKKACPNLIVKTGSSRERFGPP